jgi:hypothetical protein
MTLEIEQRTPTSQSVASIVDVILSDWLGLDWRAAPPRGGGMNPAAPGTPEHARLYHPRFLSQCSIGGLLASGNTR